MSGVQSTIVALPLTSDESRIFGDEEGHKLSDIFRLAVLLQGIRSTLYRMLKRYLPHS